MKRILTLICCWFLAVCAFSQQLTGVVNNEKGLPLDGVSVSLKTSGIIGLTRVDGTFSIPGTRDADTLIIKHLGYKMVAIPVVPGQTEVGTIILPSESQLLEEAVVSTGYYQIARERATGSFTHLGSELLSRSVSTNLLDRLEGVTNGLQFDRSNNTGEFNFAPQLRVRGLSSIQSSTAPLVVVDNFPFEGDLSAINPNDVESVTVLKDAAAASIWGTRAGNGVIVINTKQSGFGQRPQISVTSNVNFIAKPDLFSNPQFLPASERLLVEDFLFGLGQYRKQDWTSLPDYVSLLFGMQEGRLTKAEFMRQREWLEGRDIRRDAERHLYQTAVNRQYALSLNGGGNRYRYLLSAGLDQNRANIRHNSDERLTLRFSNSLRLLKQLEVHAEINYMRTGAKENGYNLQSLQPASFETSPYTYLIDAEGQPATVNDRYLREYAEAAIGNGLLDWGFRPLQEVHLHDFNSKSANIRLNVGADYRFSARWSLAGNYQFQEIANTGTDWYDRESYYVRDLVNRYTQQDLSSPIPWGGVLDGRNNGHQMHFARLQLNHTSSWGGNHDINGLAGAEVRQHGVYTTPGYRVYGYNNNVLVGTANLNFEQMYPTRPRGSARIPGPPTGMLDRVDRFVSYFANASYAFKSRYIASASVRWDGSNLFGVKTNQRGVPLWSVGGSWRISDEPFFRRDVFSLLRLRVTYGVNGNVNNTISALPSLSYVSMPHFVTNLPYARLTSAGNPSLRWEQVSTLNSGVDFALWGNRLSGSVEYYRKWADDLIGQDFLDPSTGIYREAGMYTIDNRVNYASLVTSGLDISLNSTNQWGRLKLESNFLLNYAANKVTDYMLDDSQSAAVQLTSPTPRIGKPLDVLYAWQYGGLDPLDGSLLTPHGDKDYMGYYIGATSGDLMDMGVDVAPLYGSFRNTLTYKKVSLSVNLVWKTGFYFRRTSVNYRMMYTRGLDHNDFTDRWQQPGDEHTTVVPAMPGDVNTLRDELYTYSEVLIEKGDFLRLDDVQLAYTLGRSSRGIFRSLQIYAYAKNLGFVWRATAKDIDPERPHAAYRMPRSVALGLQLQF